MSSSERPRLRSVSDAPGQAGAAPAAERSRDRRMLLFGLALLALVLGAAALWQARSASELRARLAETEAALAASERRVEALEGYLGSVRERFDGLRATLQGELEALGALLARGPADAASPDAAPPPADLP